MSRLYSMKFSKSVIFSTEFAVLYRWELGLFLSSNLSDEFAHLIVQPHSPNKRPLNCAGAIVIKFYSENLCGCLLKLLQSVQHARCRKARNISDIFFISSLMITPLSLPGVFFLETDSTGNFYTSFFSLEIDTLQRGHREIRETQMQNYFDILFSDSWNIDFFFLVTKTL